MKHIIYLLFITMIYSCDKNIQRKYTIYSDRGNSIEIIEIDSCEYLKYNSQLQFTHKGNCKYCKIRNTK